MHPTPTPTSTPSEVSVAERYLALLKERGIDYFYIGSGTDTAPIVEAYARADQSGLDFPTPIIAVHENLAVGMAHGYYMVTGRPQAVMLHVTVGAANAVCALMNAARSQVPIFFTAGRTPLYESGVLGSRNSPIHWAQEMYDQAGMARELVKWDYELRDGRNLQEVVDRGLAMSMAQPRGPIYLTLPREVLAQPAGAQRDLPPQPVPTAPYPDPAAVDRIAQAIAAAQYPVIVTSSAGADTAAVDLLEQLTLDFGIGVAESMGHFVNVRSAHPLHLGHEPSAAVRRADMLLALESDVPWIPSKAEPRADAFVAHVGTDPLFSGLPLRGFRSDLTLTAATVPFLVALRQALERCGASAYAAARHDRIEADAKAWRDSVQQQWTDDQARGGRITKAFLSRSIDEVRPGDSLVVSEYSIRAEHMNFSRPGTYFLNSTAGGLGWGFPAALGAQQAAPDKTVIAVQGDGAYIFSNPAACHQAAQMHRLPVLMVVFNNERWLAVEQSTVAVYPQGATAASARDQGSSPLSALSPMPAFEQYATASGGYGERVERREDLVPALRRALHAVQVERRHALLNVCGE
jgi:acetolactate synthase-1/2/3 large subunit